MNGRTCIVTGGNAGIGFATARALAQRGARVGIVCRDAARAEAAAASLRDETGADIEIFVADLATVRGNRDVGRSIAQRFGAVDALVNNVGAVFPDRSVTDEGIERTFALNHLGPFTLTHTLADCLVDGTGRVVNVSSQVHAESLDFDNLYGEREYGGLEAYRRSKLCNLLFTRALARRLAPRGITANALHPGVVQTGLLADYDRARDLQAQTAGAQRSPLRRLAGAAARALRAPSAPSTGITPDDGAKTSVFVASSPSVAHTSGAYFVNCRERAPAAIACDDEIAERLWLLSEARCALDPWPLSEPAP